MKSPKNKTIDFSLEDGKPFIDRCITINAPVEIKNVIDKTIIGDSLQVLNFIPKHSIDLIIADPC